MAGIVHVVGAGVAGLAAAVRLVTLGRRVALYDAGPHAGGRCRSYFDNELGCRIDNGNHLLFSGNDAALAYLNEIGAADTLTGPKEPAFPFLDAVTGERWTVRPDLGRMPWWVLDGRRRVPGTVARDYLSAVRLLTAPSGTTVAERLDTRSAVFRRLWEPLAVAALNTQAAEGDARLMRAVLLESFGRGGAACRPLVPVVGLSESFVDPALDFLRAKGAIVQFGARLRTLGLADDRICALDIESGRVAIGVDDAVVLAVTAPVAQRLVPGLVGPTTFRSILNAHYRTPLGGDGPLFIGLVGTNAEWVFRKDGVLSVTVSAAERLIDRNAEDLAPLLWRDVVRAYDLGAAEMPPWRIVKERRATFAATPEQAARRPGAATRWKNLFLAGDWTDTGLPSTIEGAIRSGHRAAALVSG